MDGGRVLCRVGWTVTCSGGASMLGPAGVVEWMQLAGSCWSASDGLAKKHDQSPVAPPPLRRRDRSPQQRTLCQ